MVFFDFLYYSICLFYFDYKEKGPQFTAAGFIAMFWTMNVLSVVMIFWPRSHISKLWAVALFVVFNVYTYYRYVYKDNRAVDVLEKEWESKPRAVQKHWDSFFFLYGIGSVVVCFGMAIYVHSLK